MRYGRLTLDIYAVQFVYWWGKLRCDIIFQRKHNSLLKYDCGLLHKNIWIVKPYMIQCIEWQNFDTKAQFVHQSQNCWGIVVVII